MSAKNELAKTERTVSAPAYTVADVHAVAEAMARSGLWGIRDTNQMFALALLAQSQHRHPASVVQEYDIIKGRPALKAQAAQARFQAAGGTITWLQRDDQAAEAEFSHPLGGSLKIRWDIDRAKMAGVLGKDNWRQYPRAMLSARVVAEGVRAILPGVLGGVYLAEEVQDFSDRSPRREPVQVAQVVETSPAPSTIDSAAIERLIAVGANNGFSRDVVLEMLGDDLSKAHARDVYETLTMPAADAAATEAGEAETGIVNEEEETENVRD